MINITPNPLQAGGTATIHYSSPDRANMTITVDIDNGGELADSVTIHLDSNGVGDATWNVPQSGWTLANFNAPGCEEVTLAIESSEAAVP